MKRQDVVSLLETLLPYARRGEVRYRDISQTMDDPFWKALMIRYWQKYAQCAAELETKVLYHGGGLKPADPGVSEQPVDSFAQCLSEELRTARAYEDALTETLPVDVQMVLQRHLLIVTDIARRLDVAPHRTPPVPVAA